jgi:hypothetical protein
MSPIGPELTFAAPPKKSALKDEADVAILDRDVAFRPTASVYRVECRIAASRDHPIGSPEHVIDPLFK